MVRGRIETMFISLLVTLSTETQKRAPFMLRIVRRPEGRRLT